MQNHQQALLVVLSYIIGFITAFIMFGLADFGKDPDDHGRRMPMDNTLVAPSVLPNLHVSEEGLVLDNGEEERLISAITDEAIAEPGFHVAIITSSLSPDNKYVLYCAQMDAEAGACHYFVYSIGDHKTYMVKHRDDRALLADNDHAQELSWTDDSELKMLDFTASAESLWIMRMEGCENVWGGACGLGDIPYTDIEQ